VQGLSSVSSIKELTLEPNIAKWQQKKASGLPDLHGLSYHNIKFTPTVSNRHVINKSIRRYFYTQMKKERDPSMIAEGSG